MPEAQTWSIQLFGGLRVTGPELQVDRFPTKRSALLLARVALARSGAIGRDDLAGILWPDDFQDATRLRLRQELNRLRQGLGPAADLITADRSWIRLDLTRTTIDVREFERLLSIAGADDGDSRRELRGRALDLYVGPLLPEQSDDWVLAERQEFHAKHLGALIDHTQELIELGRAEEALASALRAVRADPYHEPARMAAIQAFDHLGDMGGAMRQYLEYEKALLREFGARPSDAMHDLVTSMRAKNRPRETAALPAIEAQAPARLTKLPVYLDRVVGRHEERKLLNRLLTDLHPARLLTVTGPGGVGKTRVAVAVAAEFEANAPDHPVVFVSLSDVESGRNVLSRIQEAFGASAGSDAPEPIHGWDAKPCLLVIDNAEHLLTDVRRVVKDILLSHGGISILATSRQRLGLGGEQEIPLMPLAIPQMNGNAAALDSSPAVELFLERARAVRPDYSVSGDDGDSLVMLLERLDGLPLAIELAAARIGLLTPDQMLGQIDDRFTFLVSRRADVDPRQRSLRATIDWSFFGLSEELKRAIASLSGFHGGWTIELAQQAIPNQDVVELLHDLTERSLVHQEQSPQGTRFAMLETIRDYITSEAPEERMREVRGIHAKIVAEHLFTASRELVGPDQDRWFELIRLEMDNARAALEWSCAEDPDTAAKLAASLWRFWCTRGAPSEGLYWLDRVLARMPEDASRDWGEACIGRGAIAEILSDEVDRGLWMERSAKIFETLQLPSLIGWALMNLGLARLDEARIQDGYDACKRSLEFVGPYNRPLAKNAMGRALARLGRVEEAMAMAEQAFAAWLNSPDPTQAARAYYLLADTYVMCGRYDGVHGLASEAVERLRPTRSHFLLTALTTLATENLRLGNLEAFDALQAEASRMAEELDHVEGEMIFKALEGRRRALEGDAVACARAYERAVTRSKTAGCVMLTLEIASSMSRDLARLGLTKPARAVLAAEDSLRHKLGCGRCMWEHLEYAETVALLGEPDTAEVSSKADLIAEVLAATIPIR